MKSTLPESTDSMPSFFNIYSPLNLAWCKIHSMYSKDTFQFCDKRFGFPHPTGASTATESGRPLDIQQLLRTVRFPILHTRK